VNLIKSKGSRFLKYDEFQKNWMEVSDEEARRKAGNVMREGRTKPLKQLLPELFDDINFEH